MSNFYSLPAGTVFKAIILDIQPGKVTIRLSEGGKFTARSLVSPGARIGEESYFRVKVNNFDGLIQLEMVKGTPEERQDNLLQEAIKDAGMFNAPETMEIGRALMEKNLPLDSFTMQKAVFFKHHDPSPGMERSLFLLQEDFPPDAASLRALDTALNPGMHLSKMLEGIKGTHLSLDEVSVKPLKQYYQELNETLCQLRKHVSNEENSPSLKDMMQKLDLIQENLTFMQKVSKQVRYYQIPFISKGKTGQGELFMYRDGKAVIALDTDNLGRVEVVTDKDDKQLSFQFRGDSNEILSLIQLERNILSKMLNQKGFKISKLEFVKREERTTVLTPGPAAEARQEAKRYAFDMRV